MHFSIEQLEAFARALLLAAGMDADKAHGLAMAPLYLADSHKGGMQLTGEPTIVKDNGISAVWDGHYLPGADAFHEQMDYLSERFRSNRPVHASQPVRMPGDQAARGLAAAQAQGISYDAQTWSAISQWADRLEVALPVAV